MFKKLTKRRNLLFESVELHNEVVYTKKKIHVQYMNMKIDI